MGDYYVGMVGLGVMGAHLARNFANHGYRVAGYDLRPEARAAFEAGVEDGVLRSFEDVQDMVQALEVPRRIILLVPAVAVDSVIASLRPHIAPGDLLIDLGNSFFQDTERRAAPLAAEKIHFMGSGISGGEQGALLGPSIMPGGAREAYEHIEPAFKAIAAQVHGEPCVTYIGPGGAGHYVKMVHNGIEYGLMQCIAEAYDLLRRGAGMPVRDLQDTFAAWNDAELNSYLIQITADILGHEDPITGQPLVDVILDEAQQKGTGKWATQNALDLGVPTHTINASVEGRILSALKTERVHAAEVFTGPQAAFDGDRHQLVEQVRAALYASFVTAYAQGLALMQAASAAYGYNLDLSAIARIWRGGCIIRAALLEDIRTAYTAQPDLLNLMLAEPFREGIQTRQEAWRRVIQTAVGLGIPVPGMSAALAYFDAYRSARLPANLTQAQRDYFGSHTYRRLDQEGIFHTGWEA